MSERLTLEEEQIWLIEWQFKRGGRAEGEWEWEPDHNSGIWFSREAAEVKMVERIRELATESYRFRVVPWIRQTIEAVRR